jgi:hypothetical protein
MKSFSNIDFKKPKPWLLQALVVVPTVLLLLEAILYPGFLAAKTGFLPIVILLVFVAVQIFLRVRVPLLFTNSLYKAVMVGSVATWLLSFVLLLCNFYFYSNFSFATFHIHAEMLDFTALFLILTSLIHISKQRIAFFYPWLTFLLPLFLASTQYFIWSHYDHLLFAKLKAEDSVYEYLTFAAFLVAGVLAIKSGLHFWRTRKTTKPQWWTTFLAVGFIVGGLLFMGVAGEEISWGQRLLGIETPEKIAAVNTQGEITLHNHHAIIGYVYYSYLFISLYCVSAWFALRLLNRMGKKNWVKNIRWFVPSWYWIGYFIPMILYVPLRETYGYIQFGHWEEMSEMFWATGLLAHIWEVWRWSEVEG